jgi:hypothetical protein
MRTKVRRSIAAAVLGSLAVVAGVHAQQTRDQGGQTRAGTAALSGMVVTSDQTPQPIRRAMVTAVNPEGGVNRTTFTDEAGRFSITALPEGRYTLTATKAPFIRAAFGARRVDGPGTPITLQNAHQMTDIVLRMTRGAVLTGRITDENGEPAFGVSVRALQMRMQFGERTFVTIASAGSIGDTTDDRGIYRFFGLPPGEYVVTASPRITVGEVRAMTDGEIRAIMQALQQQQAQAAQQAQTYGQKPPVASVNPAQAGAAAAPPAADDEKVTVAYAPVYYPGTTAAASALTVTIGAGEERTGIDFPIRLVRTTTVEGMVALPPGVTPQSVQLSMAPTAAPGGTGLAGLEVIAMQRVAVGPDGKFKYTAVAPGQYTISARATRGSGGPPPPPPPPPLPPGATGTMRFTAAAGGGEMAVMPGMPGSGDPNATQYWAMADVSVDGTPISGVTLSLQPGMTITGRVEFRSGVTRPGGDFSRTQLNLFPVITGGGVRVSMSMPASLVDPSGQFKITGVTPGRYRLTGAAAVAPGSGPGPAWRLASAMVKGRDILDFQLDVAPGEDIEDAVVTFTDVTQNVNGRLQDASGRAAPDYTIVVFAADSRYWTAQSRRVRSARPSTDGRFSVLNLPPGEYRIAAVVDAVPNEINDPAFLEQIVGASYPFTLAFGETKTQDLKISGGL